MPKIQENEEVPGDGPEVAKGGTNGQVDAGTDEPPTLTPGPPVPDTPQRPQTSSGWLGWLPWPGGEPMPSADPSKSSQPEPPSTPVKRPEIQPTLPDVKAPESRPDMASESQENKAPGSRELKPPETPAMGHAWYDFWSASKPEGPTPQEPEDTVMNDAPPATPDPPKSEEAPAPSAGATWAFWSRDRRPTISGTSTPQVERGEIAVMGEGSESHPTPAKNVDVTPKKGAKEKNDKKSKNDTRKNKRNRPESMDIDPPTTAAVASSERPQTPVLEPRLPTTDPTSPQKITSPQKATTSAADLSKRPQNNLLLPSFQSTYRMKGNPSIIKQIAQYLLRTQQSPANHVFRVKEPPRIKKAIAIGVHGLFPAMYLRPMIGQPTGTSLRFASLCADAIRRWTDAHGCGEVEIEKIALEGEGKIADRVDNLWKLLLNWIDHLRTADLVIVACHSQGVPVAIMLVAKLIDLGIITNAKIGICAMGTSPPICRTKLTHPSRRVPRPVPRLQIQHPNRLCGRAMGLCSPRQ